MGKLARKTPYKKLLKEEKAKTKFKVSHKTVLPKGQNITNTSFKVKKIVVKSQLKEHIGEIVSKSNLNVKELLSRLHHHNAPLRISSLSSLSEIINAHTDTVLSLHLQALLHAASNLILDREQDVRTEAIKLLSTILTKTTESQLVSLFEIIIKYLACAMTHIDANIRRNSLEMLDILISKHANLTAKHCQSVILPAFLDLISTKDIDSERKLSLEYNNKMSSNIWRIKVLGRLQALLNAIVKVLEEKSDAKNEYVKKIKWTNDKAVYACLYYTPHTAKNYLELSDLQSPINKTLISQKTEIQTYTEILLPLLIDIFVEAAPLKTKTQRSVQHLSNEAAVLLIFVTDIILLLWQIFDVSDSAIFLKQWFSSTYSTLIINHFVAGRFPYTLNEQIQPSQFKNKKHKRHISLPGLPSEYSKFLTDKRCVNLNSTLCHMYLLLHPSCNDEKELKTILKYVTNLLQSCQQFDRDIITKLLNCVDSIYLSDFQFNKNKIYSMQLIKTIKQLYDDSSVKNDPQHNYIVEKTFNYLYKITLNAKTKNLKNEPALNSWLESLPRLLTAKRISLQKVKCIANIARCNEPAFINILDGYIESILDNLPHLEIITQCKQERIEGKKLIANLLYFVPTWDREFVAGLTKAVDNGYFSHLTNHIKDIIDCKLSNS